MKAKTPALSHARLKELLSYDPSTGDFVWLVDRNQNVRAGSVAGKTHHSGYRYISVDSERILAHRLAWFFVHGEWASDQIDHIDGAKDNNAIANLREVSQSVNAQNKKRARADNSTGMLGVSYRSDEGRYIAQINIAGKNKHLGRFANSQDAHEAYLAAKRQHHEGCTL